MRWSDDVESDLKKMKLKGRKEKKRNWKQWKLAVKEAKPRAVVQRAVETGCKGGQTQDCSAESSGNWL
jgi:hypothetical protein